MTKREQRVITAFINCVENNEYSLDYATTIMERQDTYGYLTEQAKDVFYKKFGIEKPTNV